MDVGDLPMVDFYYHTGPGFRDQIPVAYDRSAITVLLEPELSVEDLVGSLRDAGHGIESFDRSKRQGRWRLELPTLTDSAASARLDAVRARSEVRFAGFRLDMPVGTAELSGDIFIEFDAWVGDAEARAIAQVFELKSARDPIEGRGDDWRFELPKRADPLSVSAAVNETQGVKWASLGRSGNVTLDSPTDPLFDDQYYLESTETWGGVNVDINVVPAWDSVLGHDTKVGVFDNGVQRFHEDLGNLVLLGWDAAPADGDTIGYDEVACEDCASWPSDNETFHGTAVAGIILGQHDNSVGIAGIAPATTIFPVRIRREDGGANPDEIEDAINIAWDEEDVDVMSHSWHLDNPDSGITDAISDAINQGRGGLGTVVVFSGGNQNASEVNYPAVLGTTIAVGAIQSDGDTTTYSNRTSSGQLSLVAPSSDNVATSTVCSGSIFVTTDLEGNDGCNAAPNSDNNYTSRFGGTSAAAPQVAAAAALMISYDPTLTEDEVRHRLQSFADTWGASNYFGHGKLNVYRALFPPEAPTISVSGQTQVLENETCTWVASVSGEEPLSFVWYLNGSPTLETDSIYTANVGETDFTLVARVFDTWGQIRDDTVEVDVTTSQFDVCPS